MRRIQFAEDWRQEGAHIAALFAHTRAAGTLRADITVEDLTMIFEQLAAIAMGDNERTLQLRLRSLALILVAPQPSAGSSPLPGPPSARFWPDG